MIWLIIALIACVAAIACCFRTLNAKINELRRKLNLTNARLKDEEEWATDRLWGLARGQATLIEVLKKATASLELLEKRLDNAVYGLDKEVEMLDERLLAVEYPAIREAQKEAASDDEESAIDASAEWLPLRQFIMVYGKENLMTHAELVKDVEKLFEKLFDTAAKVEEMEEGVVREDESGQYAPLAKPADDKPRSHTGKERRRSKRTDYRKDYLG